MKTFNRAIKVGGEIVKIGTPTIKVLEFDVNQNVMRATGATVPSDGDRGYAPGCIFEKSTGVAGSTMYVNEGSATSADFNLNITGVAKITTITATKAVTAAESGTTFFIDNATAFVTTLPSPAAGLKYTFIIKTAVTSGNHTIVSTSSANIIKGLQNSVAGDAGDSGTADDTISFVANQALPADKVELISDGTSWFAYAISKVAAGITFTQASA